MQFGKLQIARAYQAVQQALEDAIMSGALAPGQPLPTETELAEKFGVTRHTVREGMRALEQSGLVKRDAGRRLHVTRPKHDALASQSSRALLMQQVSFREIWEVAMQLELLAMDLLAEQVDDALIADLDANIAAMALALERGESIIALDVAFHALIAHATRNRVLLLSREPVSQLFYPSLDRLFTHPKTRDRSPQRLLDAHREIVEGLRARDLPAARLWMHRHMADFRRGYEHAGLSLDMPISGQDPV
ncbi:GntR family transcriptional regulator [Sphingomonas sp. AOB5]|uniref:FadR/GntR family transcriptional regulator n=1 Tax=Sphingomonas sp. AOB5 TaxID=3034017 RepID=UPI0023F6ACA9|nr:FCD domain-containing protein [Sphingomonas sp. AOB5]MDF7775369.1 GntR family transcriptional regulator [Sphingomonas sp. AOB5]